MNNNSNKDINLRVITVFIIFVIVLVNYFNNNMSDFLLIPYQDYNEEYEARHLRYSLGLTKDFIKTTYESVIDQKYRN